MRMVKFILRYPLCIENTIKKHLLDAFCYHFDENINTGQKRNDAGKYYGS